MFPEYRGTISSSIEWNFIFYWTKLLKKKKEMNKISGDQRRTNYSTVSDIISKETFHQGRFYEYRFFVSSFSGWNTRGVSRRGYTLHKDLTAALRDIPWNLPSKQIVFSYLVGRVSYFKLERVNTFHPLPWSMLSPCVTENRRINRQA